MTVDSRSAQEGSSRPKPLRLIYLFVRFVYLLVVLLYVVVGVVYFVLRYYVGEDNVIVTLGNLFLHWYLLLAVFFLPLALLMRGWLHSVLLLILMLAFGVLFGELFIANLSITLPSAINIRAMTFNTGGNRTPTDDLINIFLRTEADVIGLIEVSQANREYIRNNLTDEYPHQISSFGGDDMKMLLSRFPIVREEIFSLSTPRTNIEADLQLETGDVFTVFVVHPPSPDFHEGWNFYLPDPDNDAEIRQLFERIPSTQPVMLLGDFNFTDQSQTYNLMERVGFVDAFRAAGSGFGGTYNARPLFGRNSVLPRPILDFLAENPITRIDYVWHSTSFLAERSFVGTATRSDHLPVIADLRFIPSGQ